MIDVPTKMRAIALMGHGGPEMLHFIPDFPVPKPAEGEVLVRVAAAGVNNTDINTRVGWYSKDDSADDSSWAGAALVFPRIQGIDACGYIAAVGAGVAPERIGERVLIEPCLVEAAGQKLKYPWFLGSECNGGFAEYVTVAARHAYSIASELSDLELASFPCSYSTAENLLTRASVSSSDIVLVTGASGGVGSAAVQLAKARGAKMIAITSEEKRAEIFDLGADQVFGRDDDLMSVLGENSIDVLIDLVAGPSWPTLIDLIRPSGRYAVAGAVAGPLVQLDVRTLYLKDLSFFGCTVLEPNVFANLVAHIEAGRIRPLVAETWDLKDIAKAQESFARKKYIGKIVLKVASD